MSRTARFAGIAVALAAGAVLALAARPSGPGRAAVTSTSPADGATVAVAPDRVELSFSGGVDPDLSHVSAQGPARNAGALGRPAPDRLSQPIAVPAAGPVTVAYHVTLADGAELTGTLHFTVATANPPEPAAGAADQGAAHAHGIDPISAVLLLADGLAVVVVGVLLMRRPRRAGRR